MWKRLMVGGSLVFAVVASTLPAQATFPGENGRIAFRRFLNHHMTWGAVFTIEPDGTGELQVTHPPQGYVDRNPDFSPDGSRIVFEREGVDCNCISNEIFVVDADGSNLTQLTHNPAGTVCDSGGFCNRSPAWSPDGAQIVFSRISGVLQAHLSQNMGLYVMNADGSGVQQITQTTEFGTGEDSDPQWSPNGHKIVFQRRNVRTATPRHGIALWTVNMNTGRERLVTPYYLRAGDTPDWSPDGRHILFHNNNDGSPDVSANLFTIRPDGSQLRQLTFLEGGEVNYLGSSYSPDGTMIVFGRRPATGGAADVFIRTVDGERHVTRTRLYDSYPDWGPAPSP
jgi:TolB protein